MRTGSLRPSLDIDQVGYCRIAAQLFQAAAAAGPDAPDRYAKPGANFSVGHRRVSNEQGKQSMRGQGKAAERLMQRSTALRHEQLILGPRGRLGRCIFWRLPVGWQLAGGAQDFEAFPPGDGGEPAGQRGRITDRVQVVHEYHPDVLAYVLGVRAL